MRMTGGNRTHDHPLSHRGAQYNLSYKKEPYREICGALFISEINAVINSSIFYGLTRSRILKR